MRPFLLAALIAFPGLAMAQGAPPAEPRPGRSISRDQFVQRAATRAGARFDAIDTGHTGVITRAQLREWRQSHHGQASQPQP